MEDTDVYVHMHAPYSLPPQPPCHSDESWHWLEICTFPQDSFILELDDSISPVILICWNPFFFSYLQILSKFCLFCLQKPPRALSTEPFHYTVPNHCQLLSGLLQSCAGGLFFIVWALYSLFCERNICFWHKGGTRSLASCPPR